MLFWHGAAGVCRALQMCRAKALGRRLVGKTIRSALRVPVLHLCGHRHALTRDRHTCTVCLHLRDFGIKFLLFEIRLRVWYTCFGGLHMFIAHQTKPLNGQRAHVLFLSFFHTRTHTLPSGGSTGRVGTCTFWVVAIGCYKVADSSWIGRCVFSLVAEPRRKVWSCCT